VIDWESTGLSVFEQAHRSPPWGSFLDDTPARLTSLLDRPRSLTILLVAGGASLQFSAIPFNFIGDSTTVDHGVTGYCSNLADEECQRLSFPGVDVHLVVPPPTRIASDIPSHDMWQRADDAAYCDICSNETMQGV
jgi:phosphoserine aminotransferase